MQQDLQPQHDALVDLGAASIETKGGHGVIVEFSAELPMNGLADD